MAAPERTSRRSINRVFPAAPLSALVTMATLTAALFVIEIADTLTGSNLQGNGIQPRAPGGLDGILWSPLLHDDWAHLLANTVPFLVFGFLAMAGGIGQFIAVTATIWLVGGMGVWLVGPENTNHIGASGLVFGWLTFLLIRGFFARSAKQIGLAVVLFVMWGGILFGVLPGQPNISWQGHLFGALAGILAARLVAGADRARRPPVGSTS